MPAKSRVTAGLILWYLCAAGAAFPAELYRDHTLLMHDPGTPDRAGLEELVFLRGIGEYYEVSAAPWIHPDQYRNMFAMLDDRGINMIRIFASSGDTELEQQSWVFPFTWDMHAQRFSLDQINPQYLERLELFLHAAESAYTVNYLPQPGGSVRRISKDHQVFVLFSFFDFSLDLVLRWEYSAWNPLNNNHPDTTPADWWNMHAIFYPNGSLNELGLLQKAFVQDLVRATHHHPNIIYEVINIPKNGNAALVRNWAEEVIRWIREADQPNRHIIGVTESTIPDVTDAVFSIDDVDLIERHDAAFGMSAMQTPIPESMSCAQRELCRLTLDVESATLSGDFYQQYLPDSAAPGVPKIRLADTDNLHRHLAGNQLTPYGRDFDRNCARWAHVAFVHGAHFNTKESAHYFEDPNETDCVAIDPGDALPCSLWFESPDLQPGFCSNCDDFWWEIPQDGTGNRFAGFDIGLADQLDAIPSIHRPYVRMAGFGPSPPHIGDELRIDLLLGNVYGHATGSELYAYAGLWWNLPQSGHIDHIPWDCFVPIGSIFSERDANRHTARLRTTSDWPVDTPLCFAFAGFDSGGNLSDPWPFLVSHPDTIFMDSGTASKSAARERVPRPAIRYAGPCAIPRTLLDSWSGTPRLNRSPDPVICLAGWNYSNLQDSQATGLFQCAIIIYLPQETDCADPHLLDEISIRFRSSDADSPWTNLYAPGQPIDCVPQTEGLYVGIQFTADIHSPDAALEAGAYCLEMKVISRGLSSAVWPYLTIPG